MDDCCDRVPGNNKGISLLCADGLKEPPGSEFKAGNLFYRSRWIRTGDRFIFGKHSKERERREMTYLDRITFNPEQCGGRPCIRGMRIRVKDVLDLLAGPEHRCGHVICVLILQALGQVFSLSFTGPRP